MTAHRRRQVDAIVVGGGLAGLAATQRLAANGLNVALVERGAAAPYFFRGEQGRHADELLDAGQSALAARRGLWGGCPAATLDPDRALAAGPG